METNYVLNVYVIRNSVMEVLRY